VANFVGVYDACVLYRPALRDLLVRLAATGLFRARWSDEIHEEWIRAVLSNRPDLKREQLEHTKAEMEKAIPDAAVTGYQELVLGLNLPDPDDRHVLAAAIRCQAGVIVTYNLKDFPPEALALYGLDVQHPDEFIQHLFDLSPARVCAVVRDQRAALKNPPRSVAELLDTFRRAELATTVAALETMGQLL